MLNVKIVDNERSQAIELIKIMDGIVKQNTWIMKTVGGESTINTGSHRMFPDVFIYGDTGRTQILQGWEVKMPDVHITDEAFVLDAQRKADTLGLNSCFIWNFTYGALYVKNATSQWEKAKEWNDTCHIKTRSDVATYRANWTVLIEKILYEINEFFVHDELRPAQLSDIISNTVITTIIARNKVLVADSLQEACILNTTILSFVNNWWRSVKLEYKFDETNKFEAYAKYVLLNWIIKFTFAHMIKGNHNPALAVETITADTSPSAAFDIFTSITQQCDFFNIFEPIRFGEILATSTWNDLSDYNWFLSHNGIANITQDALQSVLENSVNQFKRNIVGQFATPQKLAEILVKITIENLRLPCIDPCCGTGTIPKEIIEYKENVIGIEEAYKTTYASDKYSFPLQVSNIAMTKINAMNLPCRLFQSNVFNLEVGKQIQITDPSNGNAQSIFLPSWGAIVSNLPFVCFDQEGREESLNIKTILNKVKSDIGITLSGRVDLCLAIILDLWKLLSNNGKLGVITSNSWLGTLAGQDFFIALNYYYNVDGIFASGCGKWFNNADVITTLLVLTKKEVAAPANNHKIVFGVFQKELTSLDKQNTQIIVDSIKLKHEINNSVISLKEYTQESISSLLGMNIALNALFYDINWLMDIKNMLSPITNFFKVFRGIKTGQDEIYYLNDSYVIDSEYVGRIFKSARSCEYLIAQTDTDAFVCPKTLAELKEKGHTKTLKWINKFQNHLNISVPNKDKFWMNLASDDLSGSESIRLFTGMNPERRIFYGLLDKPGKINQRAIGLKPLNESTNLNLCHALLNSLIGIFYTEASSFPKGIGALDNRAENMKKIWILDPQKLNSKQVDEILIAFQPLFKRKILSTADELLQPDRIAFEQTVLNCFGLDAYYDRIRDSILSMQKVRLSVKETRNANG